MFSLPYMKYLVPTLTIFGVIALGAYTYATLKEARYFYGGPVTISVAGEGEAVAVPDIATFSFAVRAEGADATEAQTQSAEAMNDILAYLEGEGVSETDIKTTNYRLNPRYEYHRVTCVAGEPCPGNERVLAGYEVSQSVSVKVRETDTAGTLISGVGERGATNVSSLQFTIDDEDTLYAEAREKAIVDAKEKAKVLADNLDMRLGKLVGFWEPQEQMYGYGRGGVGMMESAAYDGDMKVVAPSVPKGENTITVQVNASYELR